MLVWPPRRIFTGRLASVYCCPILWRIGHGTSKVYVVVPPCSLSFLLSLPFFLCSVSRAFPLCASVCLLVQASCLPPGWRRGRGDRCVFSLLQRRLLLVSWPCARVVLFVVLWLCFVATDLGYSSLLVVSHPVSLGFLCCFCGLASVFHLPARFSIGLSRFLDVPRFLRCRRVPPFASPLYFSGLDAWAPRAFSAYFFSVPQCVVGTSVPARPLPCLFRFLPSSTLSLGFFPLCFPASSLVGLSQSRFSFRCCLPDCAFWSCVSAFRVLSFPCVLFSAGHPCGRYCSRCFVLSFPDNALALDLTVRAWLRVMAAPPSPSCVVVGAFLSSIVDPLYLDPNSDTSCCGVFTYSMARTRA